MQTSKFNVKVSPVERTSSLFSLPSKKTQSLTETVVKLFPVWGGGAAFVFNAKNNNTFTQWGGAAILFIFIFSVFFYCNCIKPANILLLVFYILLIDLKKTLTQIVKLWVRNVWVHKSCTIWSWLDVCQWNHLLSQYHPVNCR